MQNFITQHTHTSIRAPRAHMCDETNNNQVNFLFLRPTRPNGGKINRHSETTRHREPLEKLRPSQL